MMTLHIQFDTSTRRLAATAAGMVLLILPSVALWLEGWWQWLGFVVVFAVEFVLLRLVQLLKTTYMMEIVGDAVDTAVIRFSRNSHQAVEFSLREISIIALGAPADRRALAMVIHTERRSFWFEMIVLDPSDQVYKFISGLTKVGSWSHDKNFPSHFAATFRHLLEFLPIFLSSELFHAGDLGKSASEHWEQRGVVQPPLDRPLIVGFEEYIGEVSSFFGRWRHHLVHGLLSFFILGAAIVTIFTSLQVPDLQKKYFPTPEREALVAEVATEFDYQVPAGILIDDIDRSYPEFSAANFHSVGIWNMPAHSFMLEKGYPATTMSDILTNPGQYWLDRFDYFHAPGVTITNEAVTTISIEGVEYPLIWTRTERILRNAEGSVSTERLLYGLIFYTRDSEILWVTYTSSLGGSQTFDTHVRLATSGLKKFFAGF